jgi:hypothetical protein
MGGCDVCLVVKAAKLERHQDVGFVLASDICRLPILPHFGLSYLETSRR